MPRRRAPGEGTVRKRPTDGRWEGRWTPPGATKPIYRYAKTRAEAAAKINEVIRTHGAGGVIATPETLAAFLTRWLEDVSRPKTSPGTYINYRGAINKHLIPALGSVRLSRLTAAQVQALLAELARAGLSASTINRVHTVLHSALEQAMRWDLVTRNVAGLVSPPPVVRKRKAVLSSEQARAFLQAVKGHRLEALFVLAITSALRLGELSALRWADVDLARKTIRVNQGFRRDYVGRSIGPPKSRSSVRQVAIPDLAVAALRWHKVTQAEQRLRAGAWTDNDLVFPARNGNPLQPHHIRDDQYYPLLDAAGLPRVDFHALRHSVATMLLERGVHPKIVSDMLGHSTISMTMDIYSHVSNAMSASAATELNDLLTGDTGRESGQAAE